MVLSALADWAALLEARAPRAHISDDILSSVRTGVAFRVETLVELGARPLVWSAGCFGVWVWANAFVFIVVESWEDSPLDEAVARVGEAVVSWVASSLNEYVGTGMFNTLDTYNYL